jgi:hypothetical protein
LRKKKHFREKKLCFGKNREKKEKKYFLYKREKRFNREKKYHLNILTFRLYLD